MTSLAHKILIRLGVTSPISIKTQTKTYKQKNSVGKEPLIYEDS